MSEKRAGRMLSASNEATLREAVDAITKAAELLTTMLGQLPDELDAWRTAERAVPAGAVEQRNLAAGELRAVMADGKRQLSGYAAVFNKRSVNLGGFFEIIAPGAFADSIASDDIRALMNHNSDHVLGRTSAGTLRLAEDGTGLAVTLDLPDTAAGRDTFESVRRGDITGMSFGFRVLPEGDEWRYDDRENVIRTLKSVQLIEISPVAFPAYPDTSIAARRTPEIIKDIERQAAQIIEAENQSRAAAATARRQRTLTILEKTS